MDESVEGSVGTDMEDIQDNILDYLKSKLDSYIDHRAVGNQNAIRLRNHYMAELLNTLNTDLQDEVIELGNRIDDFADYIDEIDDDADLFTELDIYSLDFEDNNGNILNEPIPIEETQIYNTLIGDVLQINQEEDEEDDDTDTDDDEMEIDGGRIMKRKMKTFSGGAITFMRQMYSL